MSTFNAYDYLDYSEQADAAEARAFESVHACHHAFTAGRTCDEAPEDTRRCDDCGAYFCAAHLIANGKDSYCADCETAYRAEMAQLPAPAPVFAAPATVAAPVAAAVNGWLNAVAPGSYLASRLSSTPAPRYAAIAPGLYVRVGNGKKKRSSVRVGRAA